MIQCPKCEGKFEEWDSFAVDPDKCPWCGLKKGQYEVEE